MLNVTHTQKIKFLNESTEIAITNIYLKYNDEKVRKTHNSIGLFRTRSDLRDDINFSSVFFHSIGSQIF